MESRADSIARTYSRFREGEGAATQEVRGWVEVVVRTGNWHFEDEESVVQNVLIALIGIARDDRVSDPGAFLKFARTVAKRSCVTQYYADRRRREREQPDETVDGEVPANDEDFLAQRQQQRAFAYIVQQLSDDCRALWERVYCERREQQEIATELDISVNNLRVRIHRCLERARGAYRRFLRYETTPRGA